MPQKSGTALVTIEQLDFTLMPDLELSQAKGSDFDLLVFVAGRGNRELWDLALLQLENHSSTIATVAADGGRAQGSPQLSHYLHQGEHDPGPG